MGDPLLSLDPRGIRVALELAGKICGTLNNTKIIVVAGAGTSEDLHWISTTTRQY